MCVGCSLLHPTSISGGRGSVTVVLVLLPDEAGLDSSSVGEDSASGSVYWVAVSPLRSETSRHHRPLVLDIML